MTIAGGIAAALFARERTGEPSVVDISLLGTGLWAMGAGLTGSMLAAGASFSPGAGASFINPLVGMYRTQGGGSLVLTMLQGHPYWADTVSAMGRPELGEDPRFATAEAFAKNHAEAREVLQETFETATLEEWRDRLASMRGQWGPFQTLDQITRDPQVLANDHLIDVDAGDGRKFKLVASPVQFDETAPALRKGPEQGQHTEEVMLELGLDWERIAKLKELGVIN